MMKKNTRKIIIILSIAIFLFCLFTPIVSKISGLSTSFRNVKHKERSAIHVVLRSGHGSIIDSKYQTLGKQSPTWHDSLKIYEGFSCKQLTYDIAKKLMQADIDVTIINNYNTDMSLQEQISKVNYLHAHDKRVILVDIHHNAQPTNDADYCDFEGQKGYYKKQGATGIETFTSPGWTQSDTINNYFIIPELERELPGMKFRYGKGQKGKEASFYVLINSTCPAVLIEWGFMTTYSDCVIIADECYRDIFTTAVANALIRYNQYRLQIKK